MDPIDCFIDEVSRVTLGACASNQYSRGRGEREGNAIRRENLRLYLEEMRAIRPRLLLVGEAVSHRGGARTGIAFVSEALMLAGVETKGGRVLGAARGYRKATKGPEISTEASATIVWSAIRDIDPLPMLWNAFPFHPFLPGKPKSNRVPTAAELEIGREILRGLVELQPCQRIVAVGNHAARSLERLAIPHEKVRHPSQGGKPAFLAGLARVCREL